MNHGNHIKFGDVIRFRSGSSALMKVEKLDALCGYVTYHGVHLYGEWISIADKNCQIANKEDFIT